MQWRFGKWHWLGLAVLVAVATALVSRERSNSLEAQVSTEAPHVSAAETAVRVDVTHPQPGGVVRMSTQPGSVIAFESAELFAKVSGYLKSQGVDIGSRVKQGQVLAEIDAPELEKAVESAQATLEQARAQVLQADARVVTARADRDAAESAVIQADAEVGRTTALRTFREKQYNRIKSLYDLKSVDARLVDEKQDEMEAAHAAERAAEAGVVTAKAQAAAAAAKIDQAKSDVENAKAAVQVKQAEVDKAQVFVDYMKIVSPYDGVITKRNFFVGGFIRAADQSGHLPLLAVNRTDKMRVVVEVPDRDVPFTQVGDDAEVEIDALPGKLFNAKVSRTADAEDPTTRTMRTEIDVSNDKLLLRQGMYGRVTIHLMQNKDALSIPSSALVGDVNDGKAVVFVVEKGKSYRRPIRVGADSGIRVEVLKGLTVQDQVVIRQSGGLADGTPVQITAK